ncbi:MAG TPA: YbjN domain-containing protein [Sphingomonas sp.]|nr:YbjN domain-containing protein [Sphingomonas sp.]
MIRYLLAALAMAIVPATAQAQNITAQNPQSVASAMQRAGYAAQLSKDTSGDPMITSSSGGSSFTVFFYNCTNHVNCATIQFFAGYPSNTVSLSVINGWNSDHRFGRAYLSDKGSSRVEMDVDLDDGGMSYGLFEDNLQFWVATMAAFEKHIGRTGK